MSVPIIYLVVYGTGVIGILVLAGWVMHLVIQDRRADREDREQHGHARPKVSWWSRFQAWLTDHYGAPVVKREVADVDEMAALMVPILSDPFVEVAMSIQVPALAASVPPDAPHASAGTSNVTAYRLPRADAVTLHRPARAESVLGGSLVPGRPVETLDQLWELAAARPLELNHPVHYYAAQARAIAGGNAACGNWQPQGDDDTGYNRGDRDQLYALLLDDHTAATVAIRRRFADLAVRDDVRFNRITAAITAGGAA